MSQIEKKGIKANAVDGTKIRLLNNQMIRARNAADSADVDLIKVNASNEIEFPSLPKVSGSSIATQSYVASAVEVASEGILPKDAVRVATTAALPACTYDNGTAGVGATLTGDANGALSAQDGETLIVADRILVKNQVDPVENGIYDVSVVGDGSNPFVLTRAVDFDNSPDGEVRVGARTFVFDGTANLYKAFVMVTVGAITVGTSDLVFALYSQSASDVASVNGATGVVVLDSDDIAEGAANFYYTEGRFDSSFAGKDTGDLAEGSNLYFTNARVKSALSSGAEQLTLNGTDISNQYKDLAQIALNGSLVVVAFGIVQTQGVDYTLSVVSSKTRITFAGDLATSGAAELVSGDVLNVQYLY